MYFNSSTNQAIVDPAIVLLCPARIPLFHCASFHPSVQDKIKNIDNLCMATALVIAKAGIDNHPQLGRPKILHLFLHDHHFDIITKVPAFLGKAHYCDICNKGYNNEEDHHCIKQGCLGCHSKDPCPFKHWVYCSDCNSWHGCPTCIPKRFHTIADGRKVEEALQYTIECKKFLEGKGYTLTEKWECELRKELKTG
uniref:Uncharacterized protein n=1 Tax=Romanomermis culicivorax TaxID=13658 RepID=A0A915IJI4_ROMCU